MDKFFKVSAITAAMVGAIAAAPASAADQVGPQYAGEVSEFFAESTISGNFNMWMRARDRGNVDANGNDTKKETNLNHGSLFINLGFNSGYVNDVVGADFVIYSTWDMWNDSVGAGHEMNFLDCDGPASAGCWNNLEKGGVSFATAAAKFKFGDNVRAKLGYFQPSVASGLGVNWSFAPGTYRGGEIGGTFGKLDLGFVVADEYKAPWYKETDAFKGVDGDDEILFSLGARYTLDNGISLDGALSKLDERTTAHFKVKGTTDGGFYWSPQLYIVQDENQYTNDDLGYQLAFLSSFSAGAYSFRAEATYTSADEDGNWFAYRPTAGYGGSNGAYEIWWNNRSDFNHHEELAVFGSVSRDFSDIGGTGFSAGVSAALGTGASVAGYDDLTEYAYSMFTNYAIQAGALKDATVAFHYTQYFNDSDAPNWTGYANAFQDETDFKLILAIPFNVK
ncbi:multidrug transporter [Vibrio vulnificus]|uniref:multidrug transporter n=1 Tax=Vibrio vulnificus TaxID=672 RepID=UPI0024E002EF|nr:multidrug transporter [Vibrio vulnificus]MDK2610916.1 multidrug transporter [Vibrio vulnificus]